MVLLLGLMTMIIPGYHPVSVFSIHGAQVKITQMSLDFHYQEGDPFSWDEVRRIQYEDAHLSLVTNYETSLKDDLAKIASAREQIQQIDYEADRIYFKHGFAQICTEDLNFQSRRMGPLSFEVIHEQLGTIEFHSNDAQHMVISNPNDKFLISNIIVFKGLGSERFMLNKCEEIAYSQLSDLTINKWRNLIDS